MGQELFGREGHQQQDDIPGMPSLLDFNTTAHGGPHTLQRCWRPQHVRSLNKILTVAHAKWGQPVHGHLPGRAPVLRPRRPTALASSDRNNGRRASCSTSSSRPKSPIASECQALRSRERWGGGGRTEVAEEEGGASAKMLLASSLSLQASPSPGSHRDQDPGATSPTGMPGHLGDLDSPRHFP